MHRGSRQIAPGSTIQYFAVDLDVDVGQLVTVPLDLGLKVGVGIIVLGPHARGAHGLIKLVRAPLVIRV